MPSGPGIKITLRKVFGCILKFLSIFERKYAHSSAIDMNRVNSTILATISNRIIYVVGVQLADGLKRDPHESNGVAVQLIYCRAISDALVKRAKGI